MLHKLRKTRHEGSSEEKQGSAQSQRQTVAKQHDKVDGAISTDDIVFLSEAKIDEEMRRGFVGYQYNHFKMLSQGSLTDIQKLRHMRQLKPGEVLDSDEVLAMSLEDVMVSICPYH